MAGVRADEATAADNAVVKIGASQSYVRVSAFAAWIDATLYEAAAKEAAALMGDADRR